MRPTRPDFRSAARERLTDEPGVSRTVTGLLTAQPSPPASPPATVEVIPIDRLRLHADIDRYEFDVMAFEELAESIAELGVMSPVLARAAPDGQLEIVDGARRWRAARSLGHTVIPVIVHDLDDASAARFVALARTRRPIPYRRLVPTVGGTGVERVPVVISGPDSGGPAAQ